MKTLDELQKERETAQAQIARIDGEINARKAQTLARCESNNFGPGCKAAFEIRELEYIQTHWYTHPHGCSGGDYWTQGEGQWICACGHRNRLYNRPDIEKMKPLFKSVRDIHERN